jgi:hypothetical protein
MIDNLMYLLHLHYKTKGEYDFFNGFYSFYTKDAYKIDIFIDNMKFRFLKELSFDSYTACTCKETNKCKYCNNYTPLNSNPKCLFYKRDMIKYKNVYHPECKNDYKFDIDIYDINQCGCEETVSFDTFDGMFVKYKESYNEGHADFIPIFRYKVSEVDSDIFYENYVDMVFYNSKIIHWNTFESSLNDEEDFIDVFNYQ